MNSNLSEIDYCVLYLFYVVLKTGEDEAGDDEDEDQQAQLPRALAQREDDRLQGPVECHSAGERDAPGGHGSGGPVSGSALV